MEKNRLLLIPFFVGLTLMICAWYLSYPLYLTSPTDIIFNHVSVLYWFSLPLILASAYMIAVTSKNNSLRWIMALVIVMTIYSISYFYYMLPGSDSSFFRGLTEYFIKTSKLDPSGLHSYFSWPSFFILGGIVTSLSGLDLIYFEFVLYAVISFLIVSGLYVYFSRFSQKSGFLAVIAFLVIDFYFFNYQACAFSLAFALLILLLMIETHENEITGKTITILILFTSTVLTHAFVPIFFVLYQFVLFILNRGRRNIGLFLLTGIIYSLVEFFKNQARFEESLWQLTHFSPEYIQYVNEAMGVAKHQLDMIAQVFSRSVTIVTIVICCVGFVALLIKRQLRLDDKALFISGTFYSILGVFVYLLGHRSISLALIPVSLGVTFLIVSKFKKHFQGLLLILLLMFSFIPLHLSFGPNDDQFQTKEVYDAENFFLGHYNWTKYSSIVSNIRVEMYLECRMSGNAHLSSSLQTIPEVDTIFYTTALGLELGYYNNTIWEIVNEERLNVLYDSGFSLVAARS